MKYLLNNRKHATYWKSTRDTAVCVEAFADFIKASGEDAPDMTLEILLDGKKVKEVKIDKSNIFTFDNKFLLVGDAAGVDPLFGEGIAPALDYGQVAAQTIHHGFTQGDLSFRDYRSRVFTSPVGRYLLLRWAIAWWGYRLSPSTWFMHFLWSVGKILALGNNLLRKTY